MVLYGVENHFSLPGDSDVTHLFHTKEEAMAYLLKKFDENANDDGLVCDEYGYNEVTYTTKENAEKHGCFYYDNGSTIDHYRIVKYEI